MKDAAADMIHIKVNHTGKIIPYDDMMAPMKTRDLNFGDHCIGYRVHKQGFRMPDMHITTGYHFIFCKGSDRSRHGCQLEDFVSWVYCYERFQQSF